MIEILTDAPVPNTEYQVKTGNTYEETDLVLCYLNTDPIKLPIVQFQANYIVTGENI
jgi:hypothetical protein